MITLFLFVGAGVATYGAMYLSAHAVCRRRGCRWDVELRPYADGTQGISTRCKRCRRWAS